MNKNLDSVIERLQKLDPSSKFVPATEKEKIKFEKLAEDYKLPSILKDFYLNYNPKDFDPIDSDHLCNLQFFMFFQISELKSAQKDFVSSIDSKEWKDSFFAIGDQNGDFYFVDTSDEKCPVYVQFHDDPDYPNIVLVSKSFLGFLEFMATYFKIVKEDTIPPYDPEVGSYYLNEDGLQKLDSVLSGLDLSSQYLKLIMSSERFGFEEAQESTPNEWWFDNDGISIKKDFCIILPSVWYFDEKENALMNGDRNKVEFMFTDYELDFENDDVPAYYKFLLEEVLLSEENELDRDFVRLEHFYNEDIEDGKHVYVITSRSTRFEDEIQGLIYIPTTKGHGIQVPFAVETEDYNDGVIDLIVANLKSK